MGANASTAVPLYASGQVLDAARLNLTNAGVPVFSGTATRDASFGGSGEKVLAEGQLCYLEDTNAVQYYDSAAWQAVGAASGLTLVSATTIPTTVSSVTVSNAFSATYDAYKITITGGAASTASDLALTLGASSTGYYFASSLVNYSGAATSTFGTNNGANWPRAGGSVGTDFIGFNVDLLNPFLAKFTYIQNTTIFGTNAGMSAGYHGVASSFTAFTITPSSGTLTGGTIRVYGYSNS